MGLPHLPEPLRSKLGYRFDQPRWDEITEREIEAFLPLLDDKAGQRILCTIRMNSSTELALRVLRNEPINDTDVAANLTATARNRVLTAPTTEREYYLLGEIMNKQHALLRDLYALSLPRIEAMCAAAMSAGAYGAKLSGAGMGGSIIALVKNEEMGRRVVDACNSAGAKNGWTSAVGEGARVQEQSGLA